MVERRSSAASNALGPVSGDANKAEVAQLVSDSTPTSQPKSRTISSGTTRRLSYFRLHCGKQRDCTKNFRVPATESRPLEEAVLQEADRQDKILCLSQKRWHHFVLPAQGPDLELNAIVDRFTTSSKSTKSTTTQP